MVLHCLTCGCEVSRPVLPQRFRGGIREFDSEDLLPEGAYVGPEDLSDWRNSGRNEEASWCLNLRDFRGKNTGKFSGCCGADGSSQNLTCSAGHPVGFEHSDCYMAAYGTFPVAAVRPGYLPMEAPQHDGFKLSGPWDAILGESPWKHKDDAVPLATEAIPLGVAWDEPYPRYADDGGQRAKHRWAVEAKGDPWSALYWREAIPGESSPSPLELVPVVHGGACYPMDIEQVHPHHDGLSARVSVRLPDGQRLSFHDPYWALCPDVWQCHEGRRDWHQAPTQAWVRMAGLMIRMERDIKGLPETLDMNQVMGDYHIFAGQFQGWDREGEFLGRPWRMGWLEFSHSHLRRLPVWECDLREEVILPGTKVHGRIKLQGVFEHIGYWKGTFEFMQDGKHCVLPRSQGLVSIEARSHLLRFIASRDVQHWVSCGFAGGPKRRSGIAIENVASDLSGLLEEWLDHGGSLQKMTSLLKKVFPKKFDGPGVTTKKVLNDLVTAGLLDPDRAKVSITLLS